jgi:hypothetical protein
VDARLQYCVWRWSGKPVCMLRILNLKACLESQRRQASAEASAPRRAAGHSMGCAEFMDKARGRLRGSALMELTLASISPHSLLS